LKGVKQDRRGDVIRNVPDHDERSVCEIRDTDIEHIALDDRNPTFSGVLFSKILRQLVIDLNGDHASRTGEKLVRQRSPSRPDLDDGITPAELRGICNVRKRRTIVQEMLAKPF
jgi:hypothetical protein